MSGIELAHLCMLHWFQSAVNWSWHLHYRLWPAAMWSAVYPRMSECRINSFFLASLILFSSRLAVVWCVFWTVMWRAVLCCASQASIRLSLLASLTASIRHVVMAISELRTRKCRAVWPSFPLWKICLSLWSWSAPSEFSIRTTSLLLLYKLW